MILGHHQVVHQYIHQSMLNCSAKMDTFIEKLVHSFIHSQWLYSPLLCPGLFFSFVIFFTQTVGLLGRVISQSQGRNLHAEQRKHRITQTDIHALIGIRTLNPSVRAGENNLCLRPREHCDLLIVFQMGEVYGLRRFGESL
jgi:hypothetical protein